MTTQTNVNVQMIGEAKIVLMSETSTPSCFKRLLDKQLIVDGFINFLTVEGNTISVPIMEFLEIKWTAHDIESGEFLEEVK